MLLYLDLYSRLIRISIGLSIVLADFCRIIPKPQQGNVGKYVETGYDRFLLTTHDLLLVSFLHKSHSEISTTFPSSSRIKYTTKHASTVPSLLEFLTFVESEYLSHRRKSRLSPIHTLIY
jgi:hypothetical protein